MFVFLSYSFGIETINTSIQTRRSLENHTRFQIKIGPIPVFTPKRLQNHTLWGGTYIYGLYKRVYPPPYPAGQKWACLQAGNKLSEQEFPCHALRSLNAIRVIPSLAQLIRMYGLLWDLGCVEEITHYGFCNLLFLVYHCTSNSNLYITGGMVLSYSL